MDIHQALAEKGLKVVTGQRRLLALLGQDGSATLKDFTTGKTWLMKFENGQFAVVEAADQIGKPAVEEIMVCQEPAAPSIGLSNHSQNMQNQRAPRLDDDAPSP